MKLCSQCQFIYEDEQERCDMDGAQLIYEPTLDHVFPNQATTAESTPPDSFKLLIPLSKEPLTENDPASAPTNRKKPVLQIAALVLIVAVAFMAFYAVRSILRSKAQSSTNVDKTKTAKPVLKPVASAAGISTEDTAAKIATPEAPPSPVKVETRNSAPKPAAPALPEIKPLPQLKPLPTLKPIPRLGDQNASTNRNRQGVIVAVKPKAEPKKESRLGSFLKKTGRVLTKPFKS